jgi:hypothetical protein
MVGERIPPETREGVRSGILASIKQDVELRGGRTARLLLAAGIIGVAGAIGATLLISQHPFDHHPPWHLVVFSSIWAGLLIVSFALVFLEVRTPSLPLSRAALVGVLGLGLAGVCGALCPDQHFLQWWSGTDLGASTTWTGGPGLAAFCFGVVTTLFFGAVAAVLVLANRGRATTRPLLPAVALLLLLLPGIVLQSVDSSFGVFVGWLLGAALGAYVGVAAGIRVRNLLTG